MVEKLLETIEGCLNVGETATIGFEELETFKMLLEKSKRNEETASEYKEMIDIETGRADFWKDKYFKKEQQLNKHIEIINDLRQKSKPKQIEENVIEIYPVYVDQFQNAGELAEFIMDKVKEGYLHQQWFDGHIGETYVLLTKEDVVPLNPYFSQIEDACQLLEEAEEPIDIEIDLNKTIRLIP